MQLQPFSLSQLRELRKLSHDHPDSMIFKQKRSIIGLVVRYKNFLILGTSLKNKTILV